jgi:hypothetical protein
VGRLHFYVVHDFHHAYDFGFGFVTDKQLAELMVAPNLRHHVLCWSTRFTAPDKADDCRKPFFPRLLGKREAPD